MNKQVEIQQILFNFVSAVLLSFIPLVGSTLSVITLDDMFNSSVFNESPVAKHVLEGQPHTVNYPPENR